MINKVILIGNLGRDPQVRRLESGSAVAKFSVATSENYKDKNDEWQKSTEWHDVVCWRELAELVEKKLKKGSLVYIEGKLTHRKWQDKEGNEHSTSQIVATTFRVMGKMEANGSQEESANQEAKPKYTIPTTPAPAEGDDGQLF